MLTKEDLLAISQLLDDRLEKGLQPIKNDIQELKSDVAILKSDVSELKSEVTTLKSDVAELKSEVATLKSDVSELKSDVATLKSDVSDLKQRMSCVETTLENETNHYIKIIAEGHLDLTRKLNTALKVEEEKEIALLRITKLENEVRKIKETLHITA